MEESIYLKVGDDVYDLEKEDSVYVYDGVLEKEDVENHYYVELVENKRITSIWNPTFYIYRVSDDKTYFILKDNLEKVEEEKKQADQMLIDYVANYVAPEELVVQIPMAFNEWAVGVQYSVDQKVRYDGDLWKCLQAHTSQADWAPGVAPSLWSKIGDPTVEYPDWIQPTGAHDAYAKGDKVTHNGKKWVSTANANVWEPGQYGWDEVTE